MSSSNSLLTRDGFTNTPRYTGHVTPPYKRYLKDDSGSAVNLTNVQPSNFTLMLVNQSNPLTVKAGTGTWEIVGDPTQGLVQYHYTAADLADTGNWYLFVAVQLPNEETTRAFDPDFMTIQASPEAGGTPIVTTDSINIADGADVAQGATTDSATANTTIGLLKAIKSYLGGTQTVSGSVTIANTGTNPVPVTGNFTANVSSVSVSNFPATQPVSGSVSVSNLPATQTVAGSVSVSNFPGTQPISGNVTAAQQTSSTANLSSVVSGTTSAQLLASNNNRKGAYIFNDSTATLYVAFAATASPTAYTVKIAAGGYYEMPIAPIYQNAISGIWASANGNAYITEVV